MKWILLIPVCFLSGCATQPDKSTEKPISGIWIQSDAAWQAAARNGIKLQDGNKSLVATLTPMTVSALFRTWEKVKATSGVDAQLGVAKTSSPNAFAAPIGGRPTVIIGISLMDALANDADALAATLGHELAHLHYKHPEASKARRESAAGASQFFGFLLSIAGVPGGANLASIGINAISNAYSRDQEREADIMGLDWAVAAGFDACGSARTMRVLQRWSAGKEALPFFSSHPGHEERIERASARAGKAC